MPPWWIQFFINMKEVDDNYEKTIVQARCEDVVKG